MSLESHEHFHAGWQLCISATLNQSSQTDTNSFKYLFATQQWLSFIAAFYTINLLDRNFH